MDVKVGNNRLRKQMIGGSSLSTTAIVTSKQRLKCESYKGHTVDALAWAGYEGRGKLR